MPRTRAIVISQRVVEVEGYGEVRDCLDQEWTAWIQSSGYTPIPIPNRLDAVADMLTAVGPAAIILSGGNNFDNPKTYVDGMARSDAYAQRDDLESALVDYSMRHGLPLLGCCRGMQAIQVYFGGRLTSLSSTTVNHVATDHEVKVVHGKYRELLGVETVTVNSFHDFGVPEAELAPDLELFALSEQDGIVEGVFHPDAPIVGIQWHPERTSSCDGLNRLLLSDLIASGVGRR